MISEQKERRTASDLLLIMVIYAVVMAVLVTMVMFFGHVLRNAAA